MIIKLAGLLLAFAVIVAVAGVAGIGLDLPWLAGLGAIFVLAVALAMRGTFRK